MAIIQDRAQKMGITRTEALCGIVRYWHIAHNVLSHPHVQTESEPK